MPAIASYQVARVGGTRTLEGQALPSVQTVLATGIVDNIDTSLDTTIDLSDFGILGTGVTHHTVMLYVEALFGSVLVKRTPEEIGWRIAEGGYAWLSMRPGFNLILRCVLDGTESSGGGDPQSITTEMLVNNAVTDAKLRDSAGLSVIGRAPDTTGDPADIVAVNDGDVLRRSGTTLGFGPVIIADGLITDAKLRDSAGTSVIGRAPGTTGDPADIVAAADDQVLRRSGGALGFGSLPANAIPNDSVSNARLRDSLGLSVIGRSANTTGDPADIVAGTDGDVLRRSGTTLGFGPVSVADNSVTDLKLRDSAALSVIGRAFDTAGDPADIFPSGDNQVLRRMGNTLGFGTVPPGGVGNDAVSDAALRNSAALSVIGRASNSIGDPADIVAGTDAHVLRRSGTTLGFGQVATGGLADNAVNDAKLRNAIACSVIGRSATGTGPVADIQAVANGAILRRSSGLLEFGQTLTDSIGDGTLTNAKLANVPNGTFKGRNVAGGGPVLDLTAAEAAALLPVFNDTAKGLVPVSPGGTDTFLRADGTWVTPGVVGRTINVEDFRLDELGLRRSDIDTINLAITEFNKGTSPVLTVDLEFPANDYNIGSETIIPITGEGGRITGKGSATLIRSDTGIFWILGTATTRAASITISSFRLQVVPTTLPDHDVFALELRNATTCFVTDMIVSGLAGLMRIGNTELGTAGGRCIVSRWYGTMNNGCMSRSNILIEDGAANYITNIFVSGSRMGGGTAPIAKVTAGIPTILRTVVPHQCKAGDIVYLRNSLMDGTGGTGNWNGTEMFPVSGGAGRTVNSIIDEYTLRLGGNGNFTSSPRTIDIITGPNSAVPGRMATTTAHNLAAGDYVYVEGVTHSVAPPAGDPNGNNFRMFYVKTVVNSLAVDLGPWPDHDAVPPWDLDGDTPTFADDIYASTGGTMYKTRGTLDKGGAIMRVVPGAADTMDTYYITEVSSQVFDGDLSSYGKPYGLVFDRDDMSLTNYWVSRCVFDHTSECNIWFKSSTPSKFSRLVLITGCRLSGEAGRTVYCQIDGGAPPLPAGETPCITTSLMFSGNVFNYAGSHQGETDAPPCVEIYSPYSWAGIHFQGNSIAEGRFGPMGPTFKLNGRGFHISDNIIQSTVNQTAMEFPYIFYIDGADSDEFTIGHNTIMGNAPYLFEPGDPGHPVTSYTTRGSLYRDIHKPGGRRTVRLKADLEIVGAANNTSIAALTLQLKPSTAYRLRADILWYAEKAAEGAFFSFFIPAGAGTGSQFGSTFRIPTDVTAGGGGNTQPAWSHARTPGSAPIFTTTSEGFGSAAVMSAIGEAIIRTSSTSPQSVVIRFHASDAHDPGNDIWIVMGSALSAEEL